MRTLFHSRNLGCRAGVSTAIDWFFEHVEEGVILEDDCVPSQSFFPYCAELLDRYRDDERIMSICGSSYANPGTLYRASYYFSYYADPWGWATWRRAWRLYDRNLSGWPSFSQSGGMKALSKDSAGREGYWSNYFDRTAAGEIDTWDYQWIYTVIERKALVCFPVQNLISNIGVGREATHSVPGSLDPRVANMLPGELVFPLPATHLGLRDRGDSIAGSRRSVLGFVPRSKPWRLDKQTAPALYIASITVA